MTINISSYLIFFTIGLAILLPFGILKYKFRENYANEVLSKLPEAKRNRIYSLNKKTITLFKITLWLAPLYLFVIPFSLFYYFDQNLMLSVIFILLLYATILIEFYFLKWKTNYLQSTNNLDAGQGNVKEFSKRN